MKDSKTTPKTTSKQSATAFAPASVANVAVGFDILGFPIEDVGDVITATRTSERGVTIESIEGVSQVPGDPKSNTATLGIYELLKEQGADFGVKLKIRKGIPLSSGMGGSAASAVGGVFAVNALLERPLVPRELLEYALIGESLASGSKHADNVAPCLLGGLLACPAESSGKFARIPVPAGVFCVLIHPDIQVETKAARALLRTELPLKQHIRQASHLAGFITACFTGDLELLRQSFQDVIVEPQRKSLIPGFDSIQKEALALGALGCSISGAGPSIFAWVEGREKAEHVRQAMVLELERAGSRSTGSWVSRISSEGARLI